MVNAAVIVYLVSEERNLSDLLKFKRKNSFSALIFRHFLDYIQTAYTYTDL